MILTPNLFTLWVQDQVGNIGWGYPFEIRFDNIPPDPTQISLLMDNSSKKNQVSALSLRLDTAIGNWLSAWDSELFLSSADQNDTLWIEDQARQHRLGLPPMTIVTAGLSLDNHFCNHSAQP